MHHSLDMTAQAKGIHTDQMLHVGAEVSAAQKRLESCSAEVVEQRRWLMDMDRRHSSAVANLRNLNWLELGALIHTVLLVVAQKAGHSALGPSRKDLVD